MKLTLFIFSILPLFIILFSCKTVEDITPYAPIEQYPDDQTLSTLTPKRAMIIVAHDDDMCLTSGTISKLNKNGWEIRVMSLPQSEERNAAHIQACENILDSVLFFNLNGTEYRNDLDTVRYAYAAISKSRFQEVFNTEIIQRELIKEVNKFEPSVIFTLDNEIGGYGHPDHVMMSQLVLDLAHLDSIHPQFIYQSVYTKHMTDKIMKRHSERMKSWGFEGDGWEKAKKTYDVAGMPEPMVQINIETEAKEKMKYLNSYNERERKTIGFFVPAFFEYSAEEYFSVFDREFYRVIKIGE